MTAKPKLSKGTPNQTIKLTDAVAKQASLPKSGDYILRDINNRTLGLALRVYASGVKSWIVQKKLARAPRRFVLGHFPDLTYTNAIKEAKVVAAKVSQGIDPNLEARQRERETENQLAREKMTVSSVFAEYLEYAKKELGAATLKDYQNSAELLKGGLLWKMPLLEVKGAHLEAEYRRLKSRAKKGSASQGGSTQASKTLRALRAAFNRKLTLAEIEAPDPFAKLNTILPGWYRTKQRSTIIAHAAGDLKRWWDAVEQMRNRASPQAKDSPTIADYLILSLMFGGRRSETLRLKWENVNFKSKYVYFPAETTKSRRAHYIPFGHYAEEVLLLRHKANQEADTPSAYVFNASRRGRTNKETGEPGQRTHIKEPKRAIETVTAISGIQFTPHDLRRTFGTIFAELPVSEFTVEKALNHAPQSTAGKHYVKTRLEPLRKSYIAFEKAILEEAGVKFAPYADKARTTAKQFSRAKRAGQSS